MLFRDAVRDYTFHNILHAPLASSFVDNVCNFQYIINKLSSVLQSTYRAINIADEDVKRDVKSIFTSSMVNLFFITKKGLTRRYFIKLKIDTDIYMKTEVILVTIAVVLELNFLYIYRGSTRRLDLSEFLSNNRQ